MYPGLLAQAVESCLVNFLYGAQLVQGHREGIDRVVYEGRGGVEGALVALVYILEAQSVVHHTLGDAVHDVLRFPRIYRSIFLINLAKQSNDLLRQVIASIQWGGIIHL